MKIFDSVQSEEFTLCMNDLSELSTSEAHHFNSSDSMFFEQSLIPGNLKSTEISHTHTHTHIQIPSHQIFIRQALSFSKAPTIRERRGNRRTQIASRVERDASQDRAGENYSNH